MDLEYVGETHQLVQLNEESFTTIDIETGEQFNYYAKPRVNTDSIKNMLVGTWVSTYSKMDPDNDLDGLMGPEDNWYEGEISLTFDKSGAFEFEVENHHPYDECWDLNNDGNTILIYHIYEKDTALTRTYYLGNLLADKMELHFDSNQIMTREKFIYVGNKQRFNKVNSQMK